MKVMFRIKIKFIYLCELADTPLEYPRSFVLGGKKNLQGGKGKGIRGEKEKKTEGEKRKKWKGYQQYGKEKKGFNLCNVNNSSLL